MNLLKNKIVFGIFLFIFFIIFNNTLGKFLGIYVPIKDSFISIMAELGIPVKKENPLRLIIGPPENYTQAPKNDNYEITGKEDQIWFQIINTDTENACNDVKLTIKFYNENEVEGRDAIANADPNERWEAVKKGWFKFEVIERINPDDVKITHPLNLKFSGKPDQDKYIFKFWLYAKGYRTEIRTKTLIVKNK